MSRYKQIRVLIDHPLAVPNSTLYQSGLVNVWEHRIVLFDKIGYGPHLCHWCGRNVQWAINRQGGGKNTLVVDHVNGVIRDNSPANLVPSCQSCNAHRNRRVADDEPFVTTADGKRTRAAARVCLTCGETFLIALAQLHKSNHGRYCSMACVYARPR